MMNKLLLLTLLLVIQFEFNFSQDGFATLGEGTTGGAGGVRVTVCTEEELLAAVEDDVPRIVTIMCHIEPSNSVRIGANKTILGGSTDALISGRSFSIYQKKNVIIRGLRFCCSIADDGITIDQSTNVWVDHNEFYSDLDHDKDYYDGLLDIVRGSDFVTVSWNIFHDHWKAILIGSSDNSGQVDAGRLHITLHHNHFLNCYSRIPSIRFGTAHIYNNLYEYVLSTGINSRMGAEVLVESNFFQNSKRALTTSLDSREDGYAVERNNVFGEAELHITQNGTFTNPPYRYRLDPVSKIPFVIRHHAGATIIF